MKVKEELFEKIMSIMREVRALLDNPTRWTQEYAARDASGWPCADFSPHACQWCLTGALHRSIALKIPTDVGIKMMVDMEKILWVTLSAIVDVINNEETYPKVNENAYPEYNENQNIFCYIINFNDSKSHNDVIRVLDRTILKLEEEKNHIINDKSQYFVFFNEHFAQYVNFIAKEKTVQP